MTHQTETYLSFAEITSLIRKSVKTPVGTVATYVEIHVGDGTLFGIKTVTGATVIFEPLAKAADE